MYDEILRDLEKAKKSSDFWYYFSKFYRQQAKVWKKKYNIVNTEYKKLLSKEKKNV